MSFSDTAELIGKGIDASGVVVIVLGITFATAAFAARLLRPSVTDDRYRTYRQNLGRAILLGLEFLVAADIIRTVAVSPTFRSAGVLAVIVAIRTFLSVALQL
jgi:uncharacterized membrane protein